MNSEKIKRAIVGLIKLQHETDQETAHIEADIIILRFVPRKVADEWEKIQKWYA